jgi:signal transduction histidine kinase
LEAIVVDSDACEETAGAASVASVLLVDDTQANLVALGAVLKPLGVRIVEAHSGAEAVEWVVREPFAVVVLDVQMPGMDGFEAARKLRETEAGLEVPIIFLTAIHRDEIYVRRGYAAGAADYLTKPFDPEVLRARVKAFVDLFQQRERLRREQVGLRTRERDEALEKLAALLEGERAARREAEIANRAKDEFLATVSHELRTPLNAILGWTEIARRHTSPSELQRALDTVERNARAQARIIEDVLDMGRIVSGKLRLEIGTVNVSDAIDGAVQAVRPAADSKGVKLHVSVDEGVGVIGADAERLQQILWNLLSNAVKFTPSGGRVELVAHCVGSNLAIRVSDDGQGIRAEFLPHLFEPFQQGDGSTTRRHGGIGLGLAIVKQLVHAHGGTIRASSEGEEKGACFMLELPARSVSPVGAVSSRRPARAIADPEAANDIRLDGLTVLVVDDQREQCNMIAQLLVDRGASVEKATSAHVALLRIQDRLPDIVVSDIGMPKVDGYSLIEQIRSLPSSRRVPAIALTAYARFEDREHAFAAGFQAHLAKPVDPTLLVSVIANLARALQEPPTDPIGTLPEVEAKNS